MEEFVVNGQRVAVDTSDSPSSSELQKRIEEALATQQPPTPAPAEAVQQTVQEPVQQEATQPEQSGWDTFTDNVAEIPEGIASGATKAIANTSTLVDRVTGGSLNQVSDWLNENVANLGYIHIGKDGRIEWTDGKIDTAMPDEQDQAIEIFNTETVTGDVVEGITQFATGFLMTRGAGFAGNSTAALAGQTVVAENLAFNPYEDRWSNLVEQFPTLQNPVTGFLAADPDDSEVEARLKMSIEALGLEAAGVAIFSTLRAFRAQSKGLEPDAQDIDEIQKWADDHAPDIDVELQELDRKMAKAVDAEAQLRETYAAVDRNAGMLTPETIAKIKADARAEAVRATKATPSTEEWYHGTYKEFDTYEVPKVGRTADTGVWVTNSLDGAKRYASSRSQNTDGATPTINTIDMSQVTNTASVTVDGKYSWFGVPENATITYADGSTKLLSDLPGLSKAEFDRGNVSTNDIARALKQEGLADSVVFKGVNDQAKLNGSPSTKGTPAIDSMVIFDPTKVRNKPKLDSAEEGASDFVTRGNQEYGYGVTKTNPELVRQADDVIAEAFVDSPGVLKGIQALRQTVSVEDFDIFVTAAGRVLQMTTRNFAQARKALDTTEKEFQDAFKQLDARTDLSPEELASAKLELTDARVAHQQAFRQVRNDYVESVMFFRGNATKAGRAVQIQKLFQGFDVPAQEVEQAFDNLIRRAPSDRVRNSFVAMAVRALNGKTANVVRALDEIFISSILSGFKTHIVNTVGSGMTAVYLPAERAMAAGVRVLMGDVKGGQETFQKAMATYAGMRHNITESARMAVEAYKIGDTILDNATTNEMQKRTIIGRDLPFDKSTLKQLGAWLTPGKESQITLADMLGTAMRMFSTRGLAAEDEFFKNLNFRGKVYGDAYTDGLNAAKAKGLKGAEARAEAANFASTAVSRSVTEQMELNRYNIPDAMGIEDYRSGALQYARESTYTQTLEKGGRAFQSAVENIPLARQVFPFVRTPLNLISASIQRSPLAPLSGRWLKDLEAGGERRALAFTRLALGTAVVTKFMSDFTDNDASFEIQGAGPTEIGGRQNAQELGGVIYGSIKLADGTQYQISRFDPISTIFEGIGVIQDLHRNGKHEEAENATLNYGLAIATMLANDTYATSVRQIMFAMQDENGLDKFLRGRASQLVPFSGLTKNYNQSNDPFQRELRTYTDALKSSIPGMSGDLPPRYNLLGEPVEAPKYATIGLFPEGLESMMSPIMSGKVKTDPVAVEFVNQNVTTLKQSPFILGGAIDLNNELYSTDALGNPIYGDNRTAFDRFNDIMANERLFGRLTLREHLEQFISSPIYQDKLTDSIRIDTPTGKKKSIAYAGSRKDILTAIVSDAKTYALEVLAAENPSFKEALSLVRSAPGMAKGSERTQQQLIQDNQELFKQLNAPLEGK